MKKLMFVKGFSCLFILVLFSNFTMFAQGNKVLLAGASQTNITPGLDGGLVGYSSTIHPPAEYIHDELYARALVLDNGDKRVALVVVDNISIAREVFDKAKEIINEKTGIKPECIMMSATHTHSSVSGTGLGAKRHWWNYEREFDDYQLFLIKRISDAVRIAVSNLEPAKIAWGVGSVPQHVFNRRWIMKNKVKNPYGGYDDVKSIPGVNNRNKVKPAGPTNPDVSFFSVQAIDGKPISIIANYSTHYAGGVPRTHISADYFGVFSNRIQELIGAEKTSPGFVGIMSNGASGDINTTNYSGGQKRYAPYEKMKVVAEDLAQEVYRVYKDLEYFSWIPLNVLQKEVRLKIRKTSDKKQVEEARRILVLADSSGLKNGFKVSNARRLIRMADEYPRDIDVILQSFRIGDVAFVALPFEVFAETGLEIKQKSPFKTTFTVGLANGSYGYLPTPEQHKLGGYETWFGIGTNRVQKDATVILVEELIRMLNEIK